MEFTEPDTLYTKQAQAKAYAKSRPNYPKELYSFILTHVRPPRKLLWDVATGSGQAAVALAESFEKVIATDVSAEQIQESESRPNVSYAVTTPSVTVTELEKAFGRSVRGNVDLITVAQAIHWFDLNHFYSVASQALGNGGVIAVWGYGFFEFQHAELNKVYADYIEAARVFQHPRRRILEDNYRSISFPFRAAEGLESTGPFQFWGEQVMDLEGFLMFLSSQSGFQAANSKGVDLLDYSATRSRISEAWVNPVLRELPAFQYFFFWVPSKCKPRTTPRISARFHQFR